jgi:hypothetical protein
MYPRERISPSVSDSVSSEQDFPETLGRMAVSGTLALECAPGGKLRVNHRSMVIEQPCPRKWME